MLRKTTAGGSAERARRVRSAASRPSSSPSPAPPLPPEPGAGVAIAAGGGAAARRREGVRRRGAVAAGRAEERARPLVERPPCASWVVAVAETGTRGRKAAVGIVAWGNRREKQQAREPEDKGQEEGDKEEDIHQSSKQYWPGARWWSGNM